MDSLTDFGSSAIAAVVSAIVLASKQNETLYGGLR